MFRGCARLGLGCPRGGRNALLRRRLGRGPQVASFASRSGKSDGALFWKLAVAVSTGSLLAGVLYANRPTTIRFDAPTNVPESVPGHFRGASSIRGCTRATRSDLEADAAVDGIPHRTDREHTLAAPNPEQLTRILRRNEEAVVVGGGSGVLRYDINQVASNDPIEDDHSEAIISVPSNAFGQPPQEWMFWGVYDGHSGWATAAKLRQGLIANVYFKLAEAYTASETTPSDADVDNAIKAGFLALDHDIVWSSLERVRKTGTKQAGAQLLAPAISGSCALLGFYDTRTQLLRVACTGDSRAVLGRRVGGSKWSATQLSADQTGENADEAARVQGEHPDEPGVVKNGRVMGYEPSRAFGDAVLKWPRDISLALRKAYFALRPQDRATNPPYMTAEPVITTTKILPGNGDFVVLASDSLWELLSNDEVVGLVGRWIDQGYLAPGIASESKKNSIWNLVPQFFTHDGMASNVVAFASPESKLFGRPPVRPSQWGIAKRHRVPVVKDINAATHIARNGLGGDDHDMISSLFLLAGKNSRRYRDDLTITVVFFGYDN